MTPLIKCGVICIWASHVQIRAAIAKYFDRKEFFLNKKISTFSAKLLRFRFLLICWIRSEEFLIDLTLFNFIY
jgi:hypothetical protein